MRLVVVLLLSLRALAQSGPQIQFSHTAENLRGVSAISKQIAWASGTHGTYLRTIDGGQFWTAAQVPDATTLDFRAVVAFSADEAFLMSAGPGGQSRIYHTNDGGQLWDLQFTNSNPKAFFDSMAFWDSKHGIVLGDPIPDEKGKLKFQLLMTEDGQTWREITPSRLPDAIEGEGAFAASNSCIAILHSSATDQNLWFATGGKVARVFHSPDRGKTWEVFHTPILHGPDSAGIFSIAFRDAQHGVIAGGDYKHPDEDGPNLAFTEDAGKTWTLSAIHPQAYFSAIAYDEHVNASAIRLEKEKQRADAHGKKLRTLIPPQRLFIVGAGFIFDCSPPHNPHRINGKKKEGFAFNAVSPFPEGGALVVGPKGTIASIL